MPSLLALVLALSGHPLHTSVTELGYDPGSGEVRVTMRIHADDLAAAVPEALRPGADSALARYARAHFRLLDRRGQPVPLAWDGLHRVADALQLRFRGRLPGGLRGAQVSASVLHARFPDQVNVVRATDRGRTTTLLFLRGDEPRALP